jgi:hypothetical protein
MAARVLTTMSVLLMLLAQAVYAESCPAMARKLDRLRLEYHEYVSNRPPTAGEPDFDELTEKLDEIVELKNAMRKANCRKIPDRPKDFGAKR